MTMSTDVMIQTFLRVHRQTGTFRHVVIKSEPYSKQTAENFSDSYGSDVVLHSCFYIY